MSEFLNQTMVEAAKESLRQKMATPLPEPIEDTRLVRAYRASHTTCRVTRWRDEDGRLPDIVVDSRCELCKEVDLGADGKL